jgi:regulatory protein
VPIISKISPQKKSGRFNLFIDGKFAFGITEFTLLENNLKENKRLSLSEIDKLLTKEKQSLYMDRASRFLSVRPRSEKEIMDYLIKKIAQNEEVKFSEASQSPLVGKILKKLKKYDYINDSDFAKWFLKSRLANNPKSIKLIKLELKQKGISASVLESLNFKSNQDDKSAIKVVEKKVARWQKLPAMEYKKKFYAYLLSRGFDYDTVKDAFAFFAEKS